MSERRAYVCADPKTKVIHQRRFLMPGEKVPRCDLHGPMKRQENNRYRGKAT